MSSSLPLSRCQAPELSSLIEYLDVKGEIIFSEFTHPREAVKLLYREFYVFLGPETRKNWYRTFTSMGLVELAEKRQERFCTYLAFLRTVEFRDYMNELAEELK